MHKLKFGVALAAVAAVLALPAAGADRADATQSTITVNGTGTAIVTPDVSTWSFGVQARGDTATATLRSVSSQMRALIAALKAAGVAAADIQTANVSLNPRENDDGTKILGYSASQSVSATLRKLDQAGAIVDAAVEAGATDVGGPLLAPSGAKALEKQALQAAYDDAKAKAQALADRSGSTLGRATAIAEQSTGPIPFATGAKAAPTAEPVPIEPGQTQVQASVTVTFAIT